MSTAADIIDSVRHRLPDRVNVYPALNRAVRLISKRLFYHKSTLVMGALSESVAADANSLSLPSTFWALMSKPYISGKTYPLEPVPDMEAKLNYTDDSTPIYYEIQGQTMYLYPGTSSIITIKGDYWTRPTKITSPMDTMPYSELFDDAIEEALLHTYVTGNSTGEIGGLQNFINKAVDEVVPYLEMKSPTRVVDNLHLDYMSNSER